MAALATAHDPRAGLLPRLDDVEVPAAAGEALDAARLIIGRAIRCGVGGQSRPDLSLLSCPTLQIREADALGLRWLNRHGLGERDARH